MSTTEEIVSYDLTDFTTGGDAGVGCYVTCPRCKTRVQVAESAWWDTECQCGLRWELDIRAVGRKARRDEL